MNGLSAVGTIENVLCYDARNRVLVAHRGNDGGAEPWSVKRTYHYDAANSWTKVVENRDGPVGHDARTLFYYDPVGAAGLLFERSRRKLWAYSVPQKKWTELTPQGAPIPDWSRAIGYFDPARNVCVLNHGKETWVYRFRRAAR
jgi:hypothetical protein